MITCEYANPDNQLVVNFHPDADSTTIIPAADQRVLDFVAGGGVIGAYIAPAPYVPPTNIATLNATLSAPGSVVRGLALVVLDIARGQIPINPNYTTNDLLNAITSRMG